MAGALTLPSRIELQEFGAPAVRDVAELDRLALEEANSRWKRALGLPSDPIRVRDLGNGHVELRAEAVTGVVRVGETDIEISPKFLSASAGDWQSVLWRILNVVEGGHVDESFTTAHASVSAA